MAKSLEKRLADLEAKTAQPDGPLSADVLHLWAQGLDPNDPLSIQADQELIEWERARGIPPADQDPATLAKLWDEGGPDPLPDDQPDLDPPS